MTFEFPEHRFFSPSRFFPQPETADSVGLLAVGGLLEPEWLVDAYGHGVFPWPFEYPWGSGKYVLGWFSVEPRCIFPFDGFHVPRRLLPVCRSGRFTITSDRDFRSVIIGCSVPRSDLDGTWITEDMLRAYQELHHLGLAHSVEAWRGDKLVGGVYGVALRGLFAAESMFYREPDASKVALVALIAHLKRQGYRLVDIQMLTPHTQRFGAVEISRKQYLRRLRAAMKEPVEFGSIEPEAMPDLLRILENFSPPSRISP